jgi:hypothetical protein
MKGSNLGGRRDDWGDHPSGDTMSRKDLKKTPPVAGIDRPLQGMAKARKRQSNEEPKDAA